MSVYIQRRCESCHLADRHISYNIFQSANGGVYTNELLQTYLGRAYSFPVLQEDRDESGRRINDQFLRLKLPVDQREKGDYIYSIVGEKKMTER